MPMLISRRRDIQVVLFLLILSLGRRKIARILLIHELVIIVSIAQLRVSGMKRICSGCIIRSHSCKLLTHSGLILKNETILKLCPLQLRYPLFHQLVLSTLLPKRFH
jgi:hypothetical protein